MEVDRVGRASRRRCEAGAFLLQCECPALCAALTGRTHGCTDQPANVKKSLANSEPSTHGTKRTYRDGLLFVRFRGEANIQGCGPSLAWVAHDPSPPFDDQFCGDAPRAIPTTVW